MKAPAPPHPNGDPGGCWSVRRGDGSGLRDGSMETRRRKPLKTGSRAERTSENDSQLSAGEGGGHLRDNWECPGNVLGMSWISQSWLEVGQTRRRTTRHPRHTFLSCRPSSRSPHTCVSDSYLCFKTFPSLSLSCVLHFLAGRRVSCLGCDLTMVTCNPD